MNTNYRTIAKIVTNNTLFGKGQGLLMGNMGLCIFLYHISRETKNKFYEQFADEILDEIFGNLYSFEKADFENGLSGIGWGIEYLVQNGFVEGDTDLILEDIDREVFKKLTQENINNFNLTEGLIGYLYFLIWRLKNKKNNQTIDLQINQELMISIINKIDEIVTPRFSTIVEDISFDLFWDFPLLLHALYEAFKLDIYNVKIIRMIKQWITNFEVYMPFMSINRIYLATTLMLIFQIIPEKRLEKQIRLLLISVDFEILKTEIDKQSLNIRFGWIGFIWVLERACEIIPANFPNHSLIGMAAKEIREENSKILGESIEELKTDNLNVGIATGIVGIGLLELLFPVNNKK